METGNNNDCSAFMPSTSTTESNNLDQKANMNRNKVSCQPVRIKSQYSHNNNTKRRLVNFLSDRYRMPYSSKIANITKDHGPFMRQMNLMKKLPIHDGCVNTICWNKTGEYILSGSDDGNLCITKPLYLFDDSKDYTVLHKLPRSHRGNIFGAQFMPNTGDTIIASCSSEGPVLVHDLNSIDTPAGIINYNCHSSTIYDVIPLHDCDNVFLSCSEDKTIRLFDLRVHRSCSRASTCPHPALIRNSLAMTTISVHPLNSNLILVGRADGVGQVYDRRKLPNPSEFSREKAHADRLAKLSSGQAYESGYKYMHPLEGVVSRFTLADMDEKYRFTTLCYNSTGDQILASYSGDYVYLFDHDRSSNIDLIQTLPKKAQKEEEDDNNSDSNRSQTNAGNPNQNNNNSSTNSSRGPRVSRIRLRGDWSDTGVNSVPLSAPRAGDLNSSSGLFATLQQAAEVALRYRIRGSGSRYFRTELIAGPLGLNSNNNDDNNRSEPAPQQQQQHQSTTRRQTQDHQRTIEEENEEDFVDLTSGDDGDDEDDDDDDDGIHDSNSDLDPDFEITFQPLNQDEASERDEDEGEDQSNSGNRRYRTDDTESENDDRQKKKSCNSRVSDQTKMKFRRAFDRLIEQNRLNKIPTYYPQIKYQGHRNSKTFIKESVFWGDNYVMSGSDCGRIFVWDKNSANIVTAFPADDRVVNCLAPNPHYYALASSGIDYDIKLWSTQFIKDSPLLVSKEEMNKIVENNELMLEESKQTISVPPQMFFNFLASLARDRIPVGRR